VRLRHARLGLIQAADPRRLRERILGLIAATGVVLRDHRTRISFDRKLVYFIYLFIYLNVAANITQVHKFES
jgi:hypothetical protein